MRITGWVFVLGIVGALSVTVATQQQSPAGTATPLPAPEPREPAWAFPVIGELLPAEDASPKSVPGSTKQYTPGQIDDLRNPPDWFPNEHSTPATRIVKGEGNTFACGACHLMNGQGHPESATISGFTADYIVQQLADFKAGRRKDFAKRMDVIANGLSDADVRQIAEWLASVKPQSWTTVKEAAMVPVTIVGQGRMRFVKPGGGMEPIGKRIITVPEDPDRARHRDPHSGFIAYVPPGSIAKGRALAQGGKKTIACETCHGEGLKGLANVPRIAGLHPIYIARELIFFKEGNRNGADSPLMKKTVAQLTDEDIINLSAYVASLPRE